jgi:prolipoprotein diacylglyceryl transferase
VVFSVPAAIPSPSRGSWGLGPFELRAYALCVLAGIVLAVWLGNKRWLARGGEPGVVADTAVWAVPFGIVGARLYHVITDNNLYFREGRDPWRVFQIWQGGLGIWGGIAGGAIGVWIACRRRGVPLPAMADALAPGILLAQAVGRLGNWFNQELFGRPTDLPWALKIDAAHRPAGYENVDTFHPTFLYESLWAILVAVLLLWLDRRFQIGHGRLFAMYVAGYTLGRGFWEYLRIDPANEIVGVRVNLWVSGLLFVAAIGYFVWSSRVHPGREEPEDLRGFYEEEDPFAGTSAMADESEPFALPDDAADEDAADEDAINEDAADDAEPRSLG